MGTIATDKTGLGSFVKKVTGKRRYTQGNVFERTPPVSGKEKLVFGMAFCPPGRGTYSGKGHRTALAAIAEVVRMGARPIFMLDYLAHNKVPKRSFRKILLGIKQACDEHSIPLLGGETAKMGGSFPEKNHWEIVCFAVGIAPKK